ncbi:MAG: helix-turn-helix domain-containing protein [Clostridiales Family XIII bacterium]|jgi:transcriptional regulator with XRE-family HTH domain|nr:helix-turn-helix domain-containing protein [Clostridiales Family XIII bacterium]
MNDKEWNARGRLDLLLKAFEVSGKDLSKIIHVDEALISKWRNGKRALKAGSASAEKIADYFLSIGRPDNFSKIKKLLSAYYKEIAGAPEAEIAVYLKKWLADTDAGSRDDIFAPLENNPDVDVAISYHFRKNSGRRAAIDFFNDYALRQTESLELISFSAEDGAWFYEDEAFSETWSEKYMRIVAKTGHIVKIVHPVNRSYEEMAKSFIKWLPIHLTGHTVDYFIPNYVDDPVVYTYILIPGHLALIGASSRTYTKRLDTWITNDRHVLSNIEKIIQENLNRARPVFKRYYVDSGKQYLNEFSGMISMRNTRYFHGPALLYVPMSDGLTGSILMQNGLAADEIAKYREMYARFSRISISTRNRYIFNLRALKQSLSQDEVELHILTYLIGRRISVSNEVYREVIRETFGLMLDIDTIETGMIGGGETDAFEDILVMAQENTGVQFIGTKSERPFVLVLREMIFVVAVMEHIKSVWNGIPPLLKNKEYIRQQVQLLLDA